MNAALSRLYQELILDHHARPRNFGPLPEATHHAHGHNPLCGDRLVLRLRLVDGRIHRLRCEADGCAISRASASMMGVAIEGRPVAEAQALFEAFHRLVTAPPADATDAADGDAEALAEGPAEDPALAKLRALAGVRAFPMRVKCATLAWHTLMSALGSQGPVSTDDGTTPGQAGAR